MAKRGWMSDKEAREAAVRAHRRAAFREGRAGRVSAEDAQELIEDAESRRRKVWWFRR